MVAVSSTPTCRMPTLPPMDTSSILGTTTTLPQVLGTRNTLPHTPALIKLPRLLFAAALLLSLVILRLRCTVVELEALLRPLFPSSSPVREECFRLAAL